MTDKELKEILELANNTTPGPWVPEQDSTWDYLDEELDEIKDQIKPNTYREIKGVIEYSGCGSHTFDIKDHDMKFICASRDLVPKLAEECLTLRKLLKAFIKGPQ